MEIQTLLFTFRHHRLLEPYGQRLRAHPQGLKPGTDSSWPCDLEQLLNVSEPHCLTCQMGMITGSVPVGSIIVALIIASNTVPKLVLRNVNYDFKL